MQQLFNTNTIKFMLAKKKYIDAQTQTELQIYLINNIVQSDVDNKSKTHDKTILKPFTKCVANCGCTSISDDNIKNSFVVFTDGSCRKKNGVTVGGCGVYFPNGESKNISKKPKITKITNQTAELYAIKLALKCCIKLNTKSENKKKAIVVTDSSYSIGCLNDWYKIWEKNNWKTTNGQDVSNKKLIKKIVKQLQNVDVEFVHVKGHAGCFGNEMADKLAYAASTAQLS